MKKAIFNWSGGKDSALALYHILNGKSFEIISLFTSISEETERITMHGVSNELLKSQANRLKLPLKELRLPLKTDMSVYNSLMDDAMSTFKKDGVECSIFGDIYLEDLKQYREEKLKEVGIDAIFPLWQMESNALAKEFISLGFKTIIVSVNGDKLDKSFVGRIYDEQFLTDLPEDVDPCGENGEFHTFVYDAPIFTEPISIELGEVIEKTYPKPKTKEDCCFKDDVESKETTFYFQELI